MKVNDDQPSYHVQKLFFHESPDFMVLSTIKQGWLGILIQLTFIPLIVILPGKLLAHKKIRAVK